MKIDGMKSKGWTDEEIEHARGILVKAEEKKHPKIILLEKATYWFLLIIITLGTIGAMWMIEPILLFTTTTFAVILLFIFGLLFGTLTSILIKDIEELEIKHHLFIVIIIPIVAIITGFILSARVNTLVETTQHNPLLLGVIYTLGVIIPYGLYVYIKSKENGTH